MGVRKATKWTLEENRDQLCKELVERGKAGLTIRAACRDLGIPSGTLYKLAARAPEVKAAIDEARDHCAGYWERHAAEISAGLAKGNVPMTIFLLKNVAGWRDKAEVESSLTITIPPEAAKL